MKRNKTLLASAVTAAAMFMAPAIAQQQEGFVDVKIDSISAQLASSIGVEQNKLPETVKAPIGVAAAVCEMSASELAPRAGATTAECDAKTSSTAFEQIVRAEVGDQPGERKGQSMTEGSPSSDLGTTSDATTETTPAATDSTIGTTTDTTESTTATESPTATDTPGMGTGADHTPSGGTVSPDSPALDSGSSTEGITATPDRAAEADSDKQRESEKQAEPKGTAN
jgi:hypothetical protein